MKLPEAKRFEQLVSSSKPFGLRTFFEGKTTKSRGDVLVYQNGGTGYIARNEVTTGNDLIDGWKVYVGAAAPGGRRGVCPAGRPDWRPMVRSSGPMSTAKATAVWCLRFLSEP